MKDNGSGTYVALTADEAAVVSLVNDMKITVRTNPSNVTPN